MKKILPMIVFALTVISCKSETIETEKIDNTVKVQNSVSINDKEESTLDNKTLENQQASSFAKVKEGDCKGLHKVTSRDDLLQQMYATAFKSDCLFNMTAEELQDIWQVPVSDGNFTKKYSLADIKMDYSLGLFPGKSPFDFYVFYNPKRQGLISLRLTREAWLSGRRSLFSEEYYPAFFGKPTNVYNNMNYHGASSHHTPHAIFEWKSRLLYPRTAWIRIEANGDVLSFNFTDSND